MAAGELVEHYYTDSYPRIGQALVLVFNTAPFKRPIRPHRYEEYKNILFQNESDKSTENKVNRGDCMALNSKGGRIIHTMADGTVTEDLEGYIAAHPEIEIPPAALHVMREIFARSLLKTETQRKLSMSTRDKRLIALVEERPKTEHPNQRWEVLPTPQK